MKKTLLINGCSFVAGDGAFWDDYRLENITNIAGWDEVLRMTRPLTPEEHNHWWNYRKNYRATKNLGAMLANYLGCSKVDISEDGSSNDSIALSTISYILNRPPKERKNFHVCVGWTSLNRFIIHLDGQKANREMLASFHVNHCTGSHGFTQFYSSIQKYIDISFQTLSDGDFWLNYLKNIVLLENFLIANEISYTFFRSLGHESNFYALPNFTNYNIKFSIDKEINHLNWYDFGGGEFPYVNNSWSTGILEPEPEKNWISKKNHHPNPTAIAEFSMLLGKFIKNKNIL
jgi:hypothetical protein